ncbi:MAG: hypothetical protein RLZZ127_864 [Planctomycetota bacterium]|jgi:serine/threonine-protein kinase
MANRMADPLHHARIGPWTLHTRLGMGGMCEVWQAIHADSGERAAVKALRQEQVGRKPAEKALEREGAFLAQGLGAAPTLRRTGTVAGRPALVMEFIDGDPLHRLLGPQGLADGLARFAELCGLVAELHRGGVIHNDLKPENIVLRRDGRLRLLDFGSATRNEPLWKRLLYRKPEVVHGTPPYLAPEVALGEMPTPASDTWSLGVIAHVLLCGSPGRPPIARRRPDLKPNAAMAIDRCLDEDPKRRPAAADELVLALR